MSDTFSTLFTSLLASPYPLVSVVTHELERAADAVARLAVQAGRTARAESPPVESFFDSPEGAAQVGAWLNQILFADPDQGSVIVLEGAQFLVSNASAAHRLSGLTSLLVQKGITLVFVGPATPVSDLLARDHVSMDFPLPGEEQLMRVALEAVWGPQVDPVPQEGLVLLQAMARAARGLTVAQATRAFVRASHELRVTGTSPTIMDWAAAVTREKRWLVGDARGIEFYDRPNDFRSLGGLGALERWVDERRNNFGEDARRFGLSAPRGVMLLGVQGCGKSSAAKAIAGEWGLPLLRLDLGAVFAGDQPPEPTLRQAIQIAEAMAPCVLWIDEIEKGFAGGDPATSRMLGTLLTWMQERQSPIFVAATANDVESLPPELLRRGRLDEVFFVDLPDPAARAEILAVHLQARGRNPADHDLVAIAELARNCSGAELEQVIVSALQRAFAAQRDLESGDLEYAARTLIPLYVLRENEIKALRTWANDRARPAGIDRSLVDLFGKGGQA